MNDLMKRILDDKLAARKRNADLPIERKLELVEEMRDRNRTIAESGKEYYQPALVLTVTVGRRPQSVSHRGVLKQRVYPLPPIESRSYQNSAIWCEQIVG